MYKPSMWGAVATLVALCGAARADVPAVVADIPPVHALVARVMQGLGDPTLIVPPGASPHGYSLRPSEAGALEKAGLVVWMGPALTPWLEKSVTSLAPSAAQLELMDVPGTELLAPRIGATFPSHDHQDAGDHPAPGGPVVPEVHDGHDAHESIDPHAWLDPENARIWLGAIAGTLSGLDPEHADAYRANAEAGTAELDALTTEISATLATVRGKPFVVFHDAYHYFENRFDIPASGAISVSDATPPSAARIAEIRDLASSIGAVCVFSEPQFNPRIVTSVFGDTTVRIGVMDPIGAHLQPGAALYPDLLRGLAASLVDCLASPAQK